MTSLVLYNRSFGWTTGRDIGGKTSCFVILLETTYGSDVGFERVTLENTKCLLVRVRTSKDIKWTSDNVERILSILRSNSVPLSHAGKENIIECSGHNVVSFGEHGRCVDVDAEGVIRLPTFDRDLPDGLSELFHLFIGPRSEMIDEKTGDEMIPVPGRMIDDYEGAYSLLVICNSPKQSRHGAVFVVGMKLANEFMELMNQGVDMWSIPCFRKNVWMPKSRTRVEINKTDVVVTNLSEESVVFECADGEVLGNPVQTEPRKLIKKIKSVYRH